MAPAAVGAPLNAQEQEGGTAGPVGVDEKPDDFSFADDTYFHQRTFPFEFVFTGAQAIDHPEDLTIGIPKDKMFIFQRSDPGARGDMTKRSGPTNKVLIRDIALGRVRSTFPASMGLVITDGAHDGPAPIRGRTYTVGGRRFPYVIYPNENTTSGGIIHRAATDTENLIRAYAGTTRDSLYGPTVRLNQGGDAYAYYVPMDHKVIEVCEKNADALGFDIRAQPTIDNSFYKVSGKFFDKVCDRILNAAQDIAPFNLAQLRVGLAPTEDGGFAAALKKHAAQDADVVQDARDRVYHVNVELHVAYAPIEDTADEGGGKA